MLNMSPPRSKHWAGTDTRNKAPLHLSCPSVFHFKKAGPNENTSSGTNQVFYSSPSLSPFTPPRKGISQTRDEMVTFIRGQSLPRAFSEISERGTHARTHTMFLQFLHCYSLSPLWTHLCDLRSEQLSKAFAQSGHL